MKYIISYDIGTGGTKASLFNELGESIKSSFASCDTYYPQDGFKEQMPDVWWSIIKQVTVDLLSDTSIDLNDIECIGVSGHSLGVVPVAYNGKLLDKYVPIWSDSRAVEETKEFFQSINQDDWYKLTGNGFPPQLYSIFKIMWIKKHKEEIYKETDKFIGTKDYINFMLTGILATDHSYASGSGVYDLLEHRYNEKLIEASKIDFKKLPDILPSTHILGTLTDEASNLLGLPKSVKVVAGGVDNSCMALGSGCIDQGDCYTSLGTSAWIAVSSDKPILNIEKKPYVFAHCVPDMYASATAIFSAGNSYRWLRDNLCKNFVELEKTTGKDAYQYMNELAKTSEIGAKKLFFNPSLAGGSSLDKSVNIKGSYIGLTLGHTQADMIRATLEGVCLSLKTALNILKQYTDIADDMLIVGGGSKSEFWRELFSNIYELNIIQTNIGQDAGALGAAALAAVGSGLWSDFSKIKELHAETSRLKPDEDMVKKYNRIYDVYKKISDMQCDIDDLVTESLF